MKSIVVGFDEGEESDGALAFGRALAEAEEATLKVAVALDYAPTEESRLALSEAEDLAKQRGAICA
jgi:Universal stress protein family